MGTVKAAVEPQRLVWLAGVTALTTFKVAAGVTEPAGLVTVTEYVTASDATTFVMNRFEVVTPP